MGKPSGIKDDATGVELLSNEWDGIRELNNPLPLWWLWVFYATIVWAIGYWVVMPAWPTLSGYTKGVIGWSQRDNVARDVAALKAERQMSETLLMNAGLAEIERTPELFEFALAGGRAAFKDNCAPCHGSGAQGFVGYPNLNDDDWLWGGSLSAIELTVTHGVRNEDLDSRFSQMPAFLRDGAINRAELNDLTEYVISLSGREADQAAAARGAALYGVHCVSCHGPDGTGDRTQGAPNLTDGIWLYGGDRAAVAQTIANARNSSMPAWSGRLSPATIRALAVYVHSLGGGEGEEAAAAASQAP